MNTDNIPEKPPSKFIPAPAPDDTVGIQNLINKNNKFWQQQTVQLHKCFKTGRTYANNSDNKDAVNLLQDLFHLVENHFKQNVDDSMKQLQLSQTFKVLHEGLKLCDSLANSPDKDCFLAILQGYTLGCLKNYE